ncbi:hypothetical protein MTR67_052202 [Solanum verrucosum]|uniref:DUF4216 domain-containing protein n=1 Tax=Solanum verrucosum TaxID=315347 RepID=A0AAF0ZZR1_SOLVR|nr:hypothetical protein MTR67_052202 [Solanum verrucosum]
MTKQDAEDMRWHKNKRVDDGVLRHPADSLAWKTFDEEHTTFALDPRNVRLGLASDGFNPFGSMSNSYSIWPVVLIPYNIPPWLCMKQSNILLSLLIPGPKGPAYGMLSDWSTKVPPQGRSQSRGYKRDEYGFVFVDVTQIHYTNDPFILRSQAQSVYYLKHSQNEKWHAVVRIRPRNLYDVPEQESEPEPHQLIDLVERGETSLQVESDNDNVTIQREDIDGVSVEAPSLNNEEEIDLEVIDESDGENGDNFNNFLSDGEYPSEDEHEADEDDDWL